MRDDPVHVLLDGTVHLLGNGVDNVTACGEGGPLTGLEFNKALTLKPINCLMCLAWPGFTEYTCSRCQWTGNDPEIWRGATWCKRCNMQVRPNIQT